MINKRFVILLLLGVFLVPMVAYANTIDLNTTPKNYDIRVFVDSAQNEIDFKSMNMGQPFICAISGRTFAPYRIMAENMGAKVDWDGAKHEISALSKEGNQVYMNIGEEKYNVNGATKIMDVAPFILLAEGRTYIPARFLTEGLRYVIDFGRIADTQTMYIVSFTKGQSKAEMKAVKAEIEGRQKPKDEQGVSGIVTPEQVDGRGLLYFTVTVHLEGWQDGINEDRFNHHAAKLREYADLFERHGALLTLESKEMTAGCLRWGDNVLAEMEQRGHAVGIHADVGAKAGSTRAGITSELKYMIEEMKELGLNPRYVSGVCSKADWVSAAADAGFEAITGVVSYGLWSLKPNLRPEGFRPYKNIAEGHLHYPWELRDCTNPWMAKDGETWTIDHPDGRILIIPSGPNLVYAYEESMSDGRGVISGEFTVEDIGVWDLTLQEALKYTDSRKVNTLITVWSFGQAPDLELMEQWLQMVDRYVQAGRVEWKTVPEMIDTYNSSR